MTGQFVDLFDRERHGVNYWAGIAVCVGLLFAFGFEALEMSYRAFVDGVTFLTQEGEPTTLGGVLFNNLRFSASGAICFGVVLVISASFLKRDYFLPFAAGFLSVLWGMVLRVTGIIEGSPFEVGALISCFGWTFFAVGSMVLGYRILSNKVIGLSLGMALGTLLWGIISAIRYEIPLSYFLESASRQLCTGFIAGAFLFSGVARHFSSRKMRFGEFGLVDGAEGLPDSSSDDPVFAKPRGPLVTLLLLLFTGGLYLFGWIYQSYSEINRRPGAATSLTAGRALGFLFIPVFNFLWALWLWIDLPRAIEKMEISDPPGGISPDRWVITVCLFAASASGLVGGFLWRPALFLMAVFLWTGVLLIQSSLNSHWAAHGRG